MGTLDALLVELLDDGRDRGSGLFVVDGDANQFGARPCQRSDLLDGRGDVGRICVSHRLHHDRCIAAYANAIDRARNSFSALNVCHAETLV